MIDEKKLLCAFIYSAYASGYCGLKLAKEEKERHMQLYLDYLKTERYYPEKEIEATQQEMMDSIKKTNIRDYVYIGHFDIVKGRIEKETGQKFEAAVKMPMVCMAALRCPSNFYKVIKTNNSVAVAKNIFLPEKKELILLDGLERPSEGDLVTGHWDYFLEILTDREAEKYKQHSKRHIEKILQSIR